MNEPNHLMDETDQMRRPCGDSPPRGAFGDGLRVRSFLGGSIWHVDGPGCALPAGDVADVQEPK